MKTPAAFPPRAATVRATAAMLLLALGALPLSGCAGVVLGTGATVATAAAEERGITGTASDTAIMANIHAIWLKHEGEIVKHVDATVNQGRVLLTGIVPTQQMRLDAVRLAWRAPGVKEMINEIDVSDKGGIGTYTRDSWITAQLVSRLTLDSEVSSINYSVETVNHVVYLMGIAQDQAELERVKNHARQIPYVRRVVSYVVLKGDPEREK